MTFDEAIREAAGNPNSNVGLLVYAIGIMLQEMKNESEAAAENEGPYCCPVCNGKGIVAAGFYSTPNMTGGGTTSAAPDVCKSCNGCGVIWSA